MCSQSVVFGNPLYLWHPFQERLIYWLLLQLLTYRILKLQFHYCKYYHIYIFTQEIIYWCGYSSSKVKKKEKVMVWRILHWALSFTFYLAYFTQNCFSVYLLRDNIRPRVARVPIINPARGSLESAETFISEARGGALSLPGFSGASLSPHVSNLMFNVCFFSHRFWE